MSKINEYPQAAALNDTDLLVMDQVQAGTHSTKSVSIGQIKDKATSGLSGDNIPIEAGSQDSIAGAIGDLSQLTTSVTSSLVGAVNEVNAKYKDYIYEGTNVAITTSYSSGAMYYANVSLPDLDSDKLISVTLTDYGGLSNVLMFQITSKNSFRIWSKTSQTLTTLKARLFYVKSTS